MLLGGCARGPEQAGGGERLEVVVGFYPLQFLAERVAGGRAVVTNLTVPGAEPHDLELTPRQVAGLADADAVIYLGGLQPAVDTAVAQSGNDTVLDVTTVVPLEPLEQELGDQHPEEGQAEAEQAEEGQVDEGQGDDDLGASDQVEEGHDHTAGEDALDPHVWLDPTKMATLTTAVADLFSRLDPAGAQSYARNAADLGAELTELDQSFTAGLADCKRSEFITSHAAFGYLARRYGLDQIAISGLSPDAEPSPARIAEVQREAREHQITTIFFETLLSPAVAETLAGDLGLRTDVLDPVEGVTDASRGSDYLSVMRANLTALRTANGCR